MIATVPLSASTPAERRTPIAVWTSGWNDDTVSGWGGFTGHNLFVIAAENLLTGERQVIDDPALFWRFVRYWAGRSALLICGHADRDMAFVGPPPGHHLARPPIEINSPWIRLQEWRTAGSKSCIDVIDTGNWHHDGRYCELMGMDLLAEWARTWISFMADNDLGRLDYTRARQAVRSLRHHVAGCVGAVRGGDCPVCGRPDGRAHRRPWWHADNDLYRFERGVAGSYSPTRISAANGHHPVLYEHDFTAFYLSILAQERMPGEAKRSLPNGCPAPALERWVRDGGLALADITTTAGERRLAATPDLIGADLAEVHSAALYSPCGTWGTWAEKMMALRAKAPDLIATSVKALGVSLWGRLYRRNRTFENAGTDWPRELDPWADMLAQRELTVDARGATWRFRYDDDWNILAEKCDPDAPVRECWPVLAAHVLAHGSARMAGLMEQCDSEVVYAHTDSLWTTRGIPGTNVLSRYPRSDQLGGIKIKRRRDVEWVDGMRIIEGRVDAAPGVQISSYREWASGFPYHPNGGVASRVVDFRTLAL